MRILVTGASGFLGRAAVDLLLTRGHDVVGVDVARTSRAPGSSFEFVRAPFGTVPIPDGLDVVIHLACSTLPATSAASPEMDVIENIAPSVELFVRAAEAGVSAIVFASSGGTVYGDLAPGRPAWREDDAAVPVTAHGAMKLSVESYLRVVAGRTAMRPLIARAGNAYGREGAPRPRHGAVENFVRAIERGDEIEIWGDGSAVRDYVHVDDVAAAIVRMAETPSASGVFNVSTGRGTSLLDLIAAAEHACGRPARVRFRPSRGIDIARNVLDPARARSELGWAARVSLEAGIERLIASSRRRALG